MCVGSEPIESVRLRQFDEKFRTHDNPFIGKVRQWVQNLLEPLKFGLHVQVIRFEEDDNKVVAQLYLFTSFYKYAITVIAPAKEPFDEQSSYLGCTYSLRIPRAGEDHFRGGDLADGKCNSQTWERIKDDIIRTEVVPLYHFVNITL